MSDSDECNKVRTEVIAQKRKTRRQMFYLSSAATFYVVVAQILQSQKISTDNPIFPIAFFVDQVAFLIIFVHSFDLRDCFRFTLLSATMLMVTIGVLLGMNMRGHWDLILSQQTFNYGWPVPFLLTDRRFGNKFIGPMLFLDLLYFSTVFYFIKYVCEDLISQWLIRRREVKKQ